MLLEIFNKILGFFKVGDVTQLITIVRSSLKSFGEIIRVNYWSIVVLAKLRVLNST